MLQALLPNPCHTTPKHQNNHLEIGEHFCAVQPLEILDGISSLDLMKAVMKISHADFAWMLSQSDTEIFAYATMMKFGVLTSNEAMQKIAQKLKLNAKGTLELLEEGVNFGKCTRKKAIFALENIINPKYQRRLDMQKAKELLERLNQGF